MTPPPRDASDVGDRDPASRPHLREPLVLRVEVRAELIDRHRAEVVAVHADVEHGAVGRMRAVTVPVEVPRAVVTAVPLRERIVAEHELLASPPRRLEPLDHDRRQDLDRVTRAAVGSLGPLEVGSQRASWCQG